MTNVLIIVGHPNLATTSVVNSVIVDELAQRLPAANIRKLYALHKGYEFDVAAEQQAVLDADVIVFQFPVHWYSMPALLQKWLDDVFVHGFAYGSTAKIGGKKFLISFTAGAPEEIYRKEGPLGHDVNEYLARFDATAKLCGLDYQGAMWLMGVSYVGRDDAKVAEQQAQARTYAARLAERIKEL